jgi:hypothetical protein
VPYAYLADGHQRSPTVNHGFWIIASDLGVRRRNRDSRRPEPAFKLVTLGRAGAAVQRKITDNSGEPRPVVRADQQPFSSGAADGQISRIASRTEEVA